MDDHRVRVVVDLLFSFEFCAEETEEAEEVKLRVVACYFLLNFVCNTAGILTPRSAAPTCYFLLNFVHVS